MEPTLPPRPTEHTTVEAPKMGTQGHPRQPARDIRDSPPGRPETADLKSPRSPELRAPQRQFALKSSQMTPRQPIHLRPTAALAERVLLPGDPGRALALAQLLIEGPLMFNHHRGLWGYTGPAIADGEPLTIQSTGMGGPSAAIVLHELIVLGARRAIRVGTCGALDGGLELGDLVVAHEALAADGTSRNLGAGERISANHKLTAALAGAVEGGANRGRSG